MSLAELARKEIADSSFPEFAFYKLFKETPDRDDSRSLAETQLTNDNWRSTYLHFRDSSILIMKQLISTTIVSFEIRPPKAR